ncbi:DinB family protein [Allohahella sp. A8]|uniref:DinB family protein n=1 Tax=Allohahella sp. A8 TaxID=3141461 RepID=UPI003A7FA431
MKQHFELMATYNQWMNERLFGAASQLNTIELVKARGAFFGSILGTLNHIAVGDTIWLKRFATHPGSAETLRQVSELRTPASLDEMLFENFSELQAHRRWLDEQIIRWVRALDDQSMDFVLSYRNMKGVASGRRLAFLIMHFFNHQTHHRGQTTTLLSQAGQDVGVTDLLTLIPQETV